jgi:hypothetical protein
MASPDPNYDVAGAFAQLAPGYVIQREMRNAAQAQYIANGFTPLTSDQVQTIALAQGLAIEAAFVTRPGADPYPDALPPVYPPGLPRIPDSNEAPLDGWVKYGPWLQGAQF